MAFAKPIRNEENNPFHNEIKKILEHLSKMWEKMKKNESYCPNVQELDAIAEDILEYIDRHHDKIKTHKPFLKNAVIDLTEVPVMHPKMQRIAIQSSIKTAHDNIEKYCQLSF